ncbi:unnamed protein product [Moneuplotes crassus]|uniref:Ion transport domain-containing protein n=1 Tax=Euplotes crassus TaxID=5936 RepID=A0AAD1Y6W8_EUPCR|nr:unnamed protein product [Moneuplotes crassus]
MSIDSADNHGFEVREGVFGVASSVEGLEEEIYKLNKVDMLVLNLVDSHILTNKDDPDFQKIKNLASSVYRHTEKKIESIYKTLSQKSKGNHLLYQFITFILLIEGPNDVTNQLSNSKEFWPKDIERDEVDIRDLKKKLFNDLKIGNDALEYCLLVKSEICLRYIIKMAKAIFLNLTMRHETLSSLCEEISNSGVARILSFACSSSIYLFVNTDDPSSPSNLKPSSLNISMSKAQSFRASFFNRKMTTNPNMIKENSKEAKVKNSGLSMVKEASDTSSFPNLAKFNTLKSIIQGSSSMKLKKFDPMNKTLNFYKILEARDIMQEVLLQDTLDDDTVFAIIEILYGQLHLRSGATQSLVKLIISYERVELFDILVSNISDIIESGEYENYEEDDFGNYKNDQSAENVNSNVDTDLYDYDLLVSDAFSYSISINKLHITFYLFKQYKKSVFGNSDQCIRSIIDSVHSEALTQNKASSLDERLFIITKLMKKMDHKLAYEFLDLMDEIILYPADKNLFVYMPNTLKTICKIIYIISSLVKLHPSLSFKGNKIRTTLTNIGNHILHKNTDLTEVEDILYDEMYSGTKVIDLIAIVQIQEFLNNPLLDSVISNIYLGSYQRNFFLKRSLCYHIIEREFNFDPDDSSNLDNTTLSLVRPKNFKIRGKKKKSNCCTIAFRRLCQGYTTGSMKRGKRFIVGHQFMFKIWAQSPDTQHLLETLFILIIGLFMVYYANILVDSEDDAAVQNQLITDINNGNSSENLETANAQLESIADAYYDEVLALMVINTICICYSIKDIQEFLYCNVRNVVVKQFTLRFIINILTTIMVLYWHYRFWIDFSSGVAASNDAQRKNIILQNMRNDGFFNIHYFASLLTALQFFRLLIAFRLNRLFGPMAKTIGSMLFNIIQFLCIFFSVFIAFMAAGTLLFSELASYATFMDAFNTLFAASFANYDPTIYASSTNISPNVGYLYIAIYLIVSAVLLLNFLIAILSSTYTFLEEKRDGLYIEEVILHMQRYGYHPLYSSIVSVTTPFNAFFLPLTPLLLSARSRYLNSALQHIQYIPIAIVVTILFFCVSLILIPLSFLVQLFIKFRRSLLYSKGDCSRGHYWYIIDYLLFVLLGIPMLIFSVAIDTFNFAYELYYPHIKLINESEEYLNKATNLIMDGSSRAKEIEEKTKDISLTEISKRFYQKASRFNSKSNPMKSGLSLTTMGILKITLIHILESHLKLINEAEISGKSKFFVPVRYIVARMRINLMVQEHLNTILYGITYEKRDDFLKSKDFQILLDGEEDALYDRCTSVDDEHKDNFPSREIWRMKLEDFLLRSQEQWILDQFNLVKYFLLRNSWNAEDELESDMQDPDHPVYKFYNASVKRVDRIKSAWSVNFVPQKKMDKDSPQTQSQRWMKKNGESYSEESSGENEGTYSSEEVEEIKSNNSPPDVKKDYSYRKIKKIDISALIQTIEEIENRLKMSSILRNNSFMRGISQQEIDGIYEGFLIRQFSVLNFTRNYQSIKAQQNDEQF